MVDILEHKVLRYEETVRPGHSSRLCIGSVTRDWTVGHARRLIWRAAFLAPGGGGHGWWQWADGDGRGAGPEDDNKLTLTLKPRKRRLKPRKRRLFGED